MTADVIGIGRVRILGIETDAFYPVGRRIETAQKAEFFSLTSENRNDI